MVQTMTKAELVNLLENSGRNIHLSQTFTTNNENKIIKKYVDYSPTTQTIFKLENDSILEYYDYFLYKLDSPNFYGELYIALPSKSGITFDYSYCNEQSMLNLLDKRIRQYEVVLKQVKQKNKEWKLGKDFE